MCACMNAYIPTLRLHHSRIEDGSATPLFAHCFGKIVFKSQSPHVAHRKDLPPPPFPVSRVPSGVRAQFWQTFRVASANGSMSCAMSRSMTISCRSSHPFSSESACVNETAIYVCVCVYVHIYICIDMCV